MGAGSAAKRGLLFFFAFLLLSSSILVALNFHSFHISGPDRSIPYSSELKPGGRLLVILLDSLQKEDMFGPDMPFLSSRRKAAAWGVSRVASVPLSIAGTRAIFSGRLSGALSFLDDFRPSGSREDSVLSRVSSKGGKVAVFGPLLHNLYSSATPGGTFSPGKLLFSQYKEEADEVFDQAYSYLSSNEWDMAAAAFYSLDHAGHLETPASPAYRAMLRRTDDQVRRLAELAGPGDTVLITSEHGMDDNGFHVRDVSEVMETGFLLWGPSVKKGGPREMLQPDWAPTLSVLAGVSPFYKGPALPAMDLLNIPPEAEDRLLSGFADIWGDPGTSGLEGLRGMRAAVMGRSPGVTVSGALALGALVLFWALLMSVFPGDWRRWALVSPVILAALFAISESGVISRFFGLFPFSANFIISKPWAAAAFLAAAALVPAIPAVRARARDGAPSFLFFLVLLPAAAFSSLRPYDPMNWMIAAALISAWGLSGRKEWLWAFGALISGLLLRRLTFLDAHSPLDLPDRWVLSLATVFVVSGCLFYGLRPRGKKLFGFFYGLSCCLPAVIVTALPVSAGWRALLLAGCGVFALLAARRDPDGRDAWLSLWVVLFCLGTSSRIGFLSHIALIPLFISLWSVSGSLSVAMRGAVAGLGLWLIYLLPGNDFGLDLYVLHDRFILGTAAAESIWSTVVVIASRYILPASLLFYGMTRKLGPGEEAGAASAMLFPAAAGAMGVVGTLAFVPQSGFHWKEISLLIVLSAYAAVTAIAFLSALTVRGIGRSLSGTKVKG